MLSPLFGVGSATYQLLIPHVFFFANGKSGLPVVTATNVDCC